MSGNHWSVEDANRAKRMREAGISVAEIGRALGRTKDAVGNLLRRMDDEMTDEDWPMRKFRRQATQGSTRLLAEIRRVFGEAA